MILKVHCGHCWASKQSWARLEQNGTQRYRVVLWSIANPAFIRLINSFWPSHAIFILRSGLRRAWVIAFYLSTPIDYLNQCWLLFSKVMWHSTEGNFTTNYLILVHQTTFLQIGQSLYIRERHEWNWSVPKQQKTKKRNLHILGPCSHCLNTDRSTSDDHVIGTSFK